MVYLILLLLGLCLGSFVNALVWRTHEQSLVKPKKQRPKNLSIINGRSMCPHCRHTLASKDLIPLLSWLSLRGKCRYCHKKIEDSPLVELTLPILFVMSYLYWPLSFDKEGITLFCLWLIFLAGFLALAAYDLKWMLLPNKIIYPLICLSTVQVLLITLVYNGGWPALFSAFWGIVVLAGLFYVLFQVSGGKWIGGGDVKLGIILGLVVGGPGNALLLLFLASLMGTVSALPIIFRGKAKRTTRIPFGPFLLTATIIVYLFGIGIINWYKHKLLLY